MADLKEAIGLKLYRKKVLSELDLEDVGDIAKKGVKKVAKAFGREDEGFLKKAGKRLSGAARALSGTEKPMTAGEHFKRAGSMAVKAGKKALEAHPESRASLGVAGAAGTGAAAGLALKKLKRKK